jgi:uncharacterized short protein YbdD (DUF466 family)
MRTEHAISYQLSAIGLRLKRLIADGRWPMALFGMPDYPRYLAHQERRHPGAPVLSEKEFVRVELERKYAGGGGRCC